MSKHTAADQSLINLTRQKTAGHIAAVRAEQPQATELLLDLLGKFLADRQALAALVQESLAGTSSLQGVITDLIWTECEELARAELSQARAPREMTTTERAHRYLDRVAA